MPLIPQHCAKCGLGPGQNGERVAAKADFKRQKINTPEGESWPRALTYIGVSECVVVFVDYGDGKSDVLGGLLQLQLQRHVTGLGLNKQLFQLGSQCWKTPH